MKQYLSHDPWNIIEEGFKQDFNRVSESIFSLGNGRFGGRGNFEEKYSGDTLPGNYVAGVYYPDKTRVGWWKNGYPEYFAKVLNAVNWIGINVRIDGLELDLANCTIESFTRRLDMRHGYLERHFVAALADGRRVEVHARRLISMADDETAVVRYSLTPLDFAGRLELEPYLDFDVVNEDANYAEKFWDRAGEEVGDEVAHCSAITRKTAFGVCAAMCWSVEGAPVAESLAEQRDMYAGRRLVVHTVQGQTVTVNKYVGLVSSLNYPAEELVERSRLAAVRASEVGFESMLEQQAATWSAKWDWSDIRITGDVAAQQGIRFNIFQLNQTYTGEDERLNIGPKGFTGEKYGGSTYWDTEAYCLPFYLATGKRRVARNLLIYRYKQLDRAIENAEKLGHSNGAALYPMVTMNGEECHNEWEITFEEIHRNGAIAFAIFDYVRYTGDRDYLVEYGLEVLVAIARFWAQRVNWSEDKQRFVILGVTGPNEYENNVNNNWYTNTIADWCLEYAAETADWVSDSSPERYSELCARIGFDTEKEITQWADIREKMFYPVDEQRGVFLQQEGFLDKELRGADTLDASEQPISQHWSWDRILRSCFIKQADVLQGIYFLGDRYDDDTVARNFAFYEPLTVHESSLSPCVHVILAARIGERNRAYELYLRTARLDLDDYNNDTDEGCHITSMAGTWMSVVKGFGGMRVRDGIVHLSPFAPEEWEQLTFSIRFRGAVLRIQVDAAEVAVRNEGDKDTSVVLFGKPTPIGAGQSVRVSTAS